MPNIRRPKILQDYLEETGQTAHEPLSDSHLLAEAQHQLHNAYHNPASAASEYHGRSKAALQRYVQRLKSQGVVPKHDFEL